MFDIRQIVPSDKESVRQLLLKYYYTKNENLLDNFQLLADINVGVFDDDILVGFMDIDFSDNSSFLSRYLNVSKETTASWYSSVVNSEYRGHGLQRKMFKYAETLLPKQIKYIDVTAFPKNIASVTNILRSGFKRIGVFHELCDKLDIVLDRKTCITFYMDYFIKEYNTENT